MAAIKQLDLLIQELNSILTDVSKAREYVAEAKEFLRSRLLDDSMDYGVLYSHVQSILNRASALTSASSTDLSNLVFKTPQKFVPGKGTIAFFALDASS